MSDNSYTMKEVVEHYLKDMKSDIKEIKEQTTKTNGRVTSLEHTRSWMWGAIAVLTLLGSTIITLTVMAIDSKIEKGIQQALLNNVSKIEYER
jgi:hypothetical protein